MLTEYREHATHRARSAGSPCDGGAVRFNLRTALAVNAIVALALWLCLVRPAQFLRLPSIIGLGGVRKRRSVMNKPGR